MKTTGLKPIRHGSKFFYVRPDTHDNNIFNCVVPHNEYCLPDRLAPETVVVDVGAHIGSFSFMCLQLGASHVFAYEAHPENYAVAKENIEPYGGKVFNTAVWRSDVVLTDYKLYNTPLNSITDKNTGGVSVVHNVEGIPVSATSLDDIIADVTIRQGFKRINILKLDCEASEFPILLSSCKLDKVDAICGEYHELHHNVPQQAKVEGYNLPYDKETISDCLTRNGFKDIQLVPHGKNLGLFFAGR